MNYMINDFVRYNPADGTLYCVDNHIDMLSLGRVPNELLLLFVTNNGVALRREDILNELWEKKGFSASSNNLNNHISALRKTLSQCGLPELITTIPKYGFMFEAELSIITSEECMQPLGFHLPSSSPASVSVSPFQLVRVKTIVGSLLCLFVIIFILFILNNSERQVDKYNVMKESQCQFHVVGDKAKSMEREEALRIIKTIVDEENIDCNSKNDVYFMADDRVDTVGRHFTGYLLAECLRESTMACDNHYFNQYKNHEEN